MSLALVSCHGMFHHQKQLLGAFAVYHKLGTGGWQRDANFLVLRLKYVHMALASPFILHHVTHRESELAEWRALETDGRFFLDCIARRVPQDADDLLGVARAYVAKWTLYPQLAAMTARSPDNTFGRFTQEKLTLPRLPAATFAPVEGLLTGGWLAQLSLLHGDDMDLAYYRLRGVPALQALLSRLGQEDGLLGPTDDFLLAAASVPTSADRLDALMQATQMGPPLTPFLRALMLDRPDLHVLYGARMVRRVMTERARFLRGATLLVTEYQIRQLGGPTLAPIQASPTLQRVFLDKCGCDAQIMEKSGVLLRLHPRGPLPNVTFRAVSLADVILGREARIAEADAQQHHALARVVLSADPAVGMDLTAHRPSQFAHTYITSGHFLSLAQLRHLLNQIPKGGASKPVVTIYGCPALAPLADATVPQARHVISAVRELAGVPTSNVEHLARPVRQNTLDLIADALPYTPMVPEVPDHSPERINSPSHLYTLCHRHTGAPLYLTLPVTLDALPLDELLCYVYLFARFRDQILSNGLTTRLHAAFDRMAHVRPLSSEYWTEADFAFAGTKA